MLGEAHGPVLVFAAVAVSELPVDDVAALTAALPRGHAQRGQGQDHGGGSAGRCMSGHAAMGDTATMNAKYVNPAHVRQSVASVTQARFGSAR